MVLRQLRGGDGGPARGVRIIAVVLVALLVASLIPALVPVLQRLWELLG